MFNVESTKEFMSIFLLSDPVFHLWEISFVEWDNCYVLDKARDVSTCFLALIEKSAFGYFSNLKKKKFGKVGSRFSC
jgi:hypothetical protein